MILVVGRAQLLLVVCTPISSFQKGVRLFLNPSCRLVLGRNVGMKCWHREGIHHEALLDMV